MKEAMLQIQFDLGLKFLSILWFLKYPKLSFLDIFVYPCVRDMGCLESLYWTTGLGYWTLSIITSLLL